MVLFVVFLVSAFFLGWLFRFAAGIFESILIFPLFGLRKGGIERSFETKPKRFITAIIIKNVIIGLSHSIYVLAVIYYFVYTYDGNYWLYFSMGVMWSFYIISYNNAFVGIYFWTSVINYILMWFGFGQFSIPILGVLTLIVSLSYYYGRIGMFRQAYGEVSSSAEDYSESEDIVEGDEFYEETVEVFILDSQYENPYRETWVIDEDIPVETAEKFYDRDDGVIYMLRYNEDDEVKELAVTKELFFDSLKKIQKIK